MTTQERTALTIIVDEAMTYARGLGHHIDPIDHAMTVASVLDCHQHVPLDVERMQQATQAGKWGDVGHDVFGIARHWDADTKTLTRAFLPRFARSNHGG